MTGQQLIHAAKILLGTKELTGGDEPKYLPKVFVVNGHCYMFLNVARRAAYGTDYPIEVMGIREAWEIMNKPNALNEEEVAWDFDHRGTTFEGRLFDSKDSVFADSIMNPIVKVSSGKDNVSAILESDINRMYMSIRAQNILMKTGCRTYGDALRYTRSNILNLRNVGKATIFELDNAFERVGLLDMWKYGKKIDQ